MPFCPQCRNENPELGAKCPRCADRYYVYEEALADAEEDSYIGQKVADKFVIVDRISEGGMGTVYRALQLPVEREVALKVLRTELEDSTEVRNRFIREARAVSKINHPNIITLHDFGFDESDYPYMVMEYAPGQSLDKWIYERGITLERIVHVARQFLSALADAHDQGIVHRDLKPENIVVTGTGTDDDFIKLLDFGIARLVNEQATEGLTREGEVFGTPHYMSPEQAEGETGIGPEADVYAIGIMIYEMLCREAPFDAPKPLSILFKQINEDLPELKPRAEITTPDPVEDLVRRATRKDPDERFANAGEMLRALNQLADPESSNIIQVPTDASGVGNEESETMIGTGTRAVPENKEQREEVGTANTLGFDDSNPEPPDKILSAESDEDEEELPADADVEFAGYESDRKRRIALVGGAVLPRLVRLGIGGIGTVAGPIPGELSRLAPQLLPGSFRIGGAGVFLNDATIRILGRGRVPLCALGLCQPVEGLPGHRMVFIFLQNPPEPRRGRVGAPGRSKERVGQLVPCDGPVGLHLRTARRVPGHRRHVNHGLRRALLPRRLRTGRGLLRGGGLLPPAPNRIHSAPVVDQWTIPPRLLKLASPLLDERRIAMKQKTGVGALRLNGVLLGAAGLPPAARGLLPAPKLLLLPAPLLRLLFLLLQSLLANLLHDRLEFGRRHPAEAEKGVHPGHRPGALRKALEPVGLSVHVGRRAGKCSHLRIRPRAAASRSRREIRGGRVEMRGGLRKVLVCVAVEGRQIVVETPLNRARGRILGPKHGGKRVAGFLGPIRRLIKTSPHNRDLPLHRIGVVLAPKVIQAPQRSLRHSPNALHLNGPQSRRKLQGVRRVVRQNAFVGALRRVILLKGLVHLPQQKGGTPPHVVGERSLQACLQGRLGLGPFALPDPKFGPNQPHPRRPGAGVAVPLQPGAQRLGRLHIPIRRDQRPGQPEARLSFSLASQGNDLPKFLSRPHVVLLIIPGAPDQQQGIVDPLRVGMLPKNLRALLDCLLEGGAAGGGLGLGKDREVPGAINLRTGLLDRLKPLLEGLLGVVEAVVVGREVVVLPTNEGLTATA